MVAPPALSGRIPSSSTVCSYHVRLGEFLVRSRLCIDIVGRTLTQRRTAVRRPYRTCLITKNDRTTWGDVARCGKHTGIHHKLCRASGGRGVSAGRTERVERELAGPTLTQSSERGRRHPRCTNKTKLLKYLRSHAKVCKCCNCRNSHYPPILG